MKLVIDTPNPKLRIFALMATEHFERNHLEEAPKEGAIYIKPHPKGDIVTKVNVFKDDNGGRLIYAKTLQDARESKKARAVAIIRPEDIVIHEEDAGFGR